MTEFPSEHLFSATFVPELQLHIEFQMCIFRLLIVLPLPFSVKGKLKISNFAYASWLATSIVFKYCRHKLSFCEPKCIRLHPPATRLPTSHHRPLFCVCCSDLVTNNLNMSCTQAHTLTLECRHSWPSSICF